MIAALLAATLAVGAGAAAASAHHRPGHGRDLDRLDPVRFSYDDAIVEHAQVTTRNGIDAMWVDIIRPNTSERVPTILIASPYFNTLGRGWRGEMKEPHQGPAIPTSPGYPLLGGRSIVPFPEWYDEYFVPRGYAVALMDLRGTRNSSGCQEYGDRKEIFDSVDVIDWIADQEWSNGKIGMTGGSYDGTIAIGAAAEQPISGRHPDALAAIIPIRAIDRWYDYAFVNGAQVAGQSLATPSLFTVLFPAGDTQNSGTDDPLLPVHVVERKACIATFGAAASAGHASPYQDARAPFWRQRDFARTAGLFRAATFIIHGLFDFNVKTHNAGYLWEELPAHLPKKLWFYYGGHSDPHSPEESAGPPFPFQRKFVRATHRWFLQFLKGVEAGALAGHPVEVQRAGGTWQGSRRYPASGRDLRLHLTEDGGLVPRRRARRGAVAYRDAPAGPAPASVTFTTAPFRRDVRLSGQFGFDLALRTEGPDATVAVQVSVAGGAGASGEGRGLLTYGWARAYYRDSLAPRGLSTPTGGRPLVPGERDRVRFGSLYTDVVVPAGSRLEFRFSAADGGTLASNLGGTVELLTGPGAGRILVPVAAARS